MTQAQLRRLVFARDCGRCAVCGCDTLMVHAQWRLARARAKADHEERLIRGRRYGALSAEQWTTACIAAGMKLYGQLKAIDDRLRTLGFSPDQAPWEMDHIIPLAEGGKNTIENARTLCPKHHREATRELQGRLSRRPKKRLALIGEDRQGRVRVI